MARYFLLFGGSNMSMVSKLGLDSSKYVDLTIDGKEYAIRKPGVRKLLEMEDVCSNSEGGVDVDKFIGEICKLVSPAVTIDSLCQIEETMIINGTNDFKIEIVNIKATDMLKIATNTVKIEYDSNGNAIQKSNQMGMLEEILKYSKEPIDIDDIPSLLDAKMLMADFLGSIKIEPLMELYTFFRSNFQQM